MMKQRTSVRLKEIRDSVYPGGKSGSSQSATVLGQRGVEAKLRKL